MAVAVIILVNLDKGRQSGAKAHQPQDRVGKGQVFLVDQVTDILMPRLGLPQVERRHRHGR